MKPLRKSGSAWESEVVRIDEKGNLSTNIPSDDLRPLAKTAKVWFEFGSADKPYTLRGFADTLTEKEKLFAVPGPDGFVQIAILGGNAAEFTGLSVGSPVIVRFRV